MDEERVRFYKSRTARKPRKFFWLLLIIPLIMIPLIWKKGKSSKEERGPVSINPELMSVAEHARTSVVAIRTFDSQGNIKRKCSGFFLQGSNVLVTVRSAFIHASEFEVSKGGDIGNRTDTYYFENTKTDLIYIHAGKFSDIPPEVHTEDKVQSNDEIFIVSELERDHRPLIEGRIASIENLENWGKSYMLSCEFPDELNGSPVFTREGKVIGMARSILISETERVFFAIPYWMIHYQVKKKLKPLQDMSPYLHPQFLPRFPDQFELARYLFKNKSLSQAAGVLREYLKSHPNHMEAMYLLGLCLKSAEWSHAVDWFKKVLSIKPDHPEARIELGLVLLEHEKLFEAKEVLENAIQSAPSNVEVTVSLGRLYLETGETESSLRILNEALNTYGINDKRLYLLLGKAYSEKEENLTAYRNFENAVAIDPGYLEAYVEMALHFMKIKNIDSGINILLRAREWLPEESAIHCFLGVFYIWQGNIDGFKKEVTIVKDLDKRKEQRYSGLLNEFQFYANSPQSHKTYKIVGERIIKKVKDYREYYRKMQKKENKINRR